MKQLIIKESRWLRGEGHDNSMLRRSDGKQCCLGFYAKACKLTNKDIIGEPSLCSLNDETIPKQARWLLKEGDDSLDAIKLVKINDSETIKDPQRKKRIKEIFAKHNVNVTFVK